MFSTSPRVKSWQKMGAPRRCENHANVLRVPARARIFLVMARNGLSHGIAVCMARAVTVRTDWVMMAQVQPSKSDVFFDMPSASIEFYQGQDL